MMVNALYNIVDRIFIGNSDYLGTNGLAAATVCFPIMIIVLAVGLLFGIGGATLFSIKLGEGKKEEAERVLGNAFVLLVLGGIVVSILGLAFMRKLLIYFGASDATLPYAEEYMSVIFFGSVFQVVSIGLNHFIRADGSPKIAMLTMFFGAGLNTVLYPVTIPASSLLA
jgi:Na+-driven multidrug efflux pump